MLVITVIIFITAVSVTTIATLIAILNTAFIISIVDVAGCLRRSKWKPF
jgi:hypothetical protein